jgi:hypothetical protein
MRPFSSPNTQAQEFGHFIHGSATCDGLYAQGYCVASCHAMVQFSARRREAMTRRRGEGSGHAGRGRATATAPTRYQFLLTSDWHIEPWYDTSNNQGENAGGDARVSRYNRSIDHDMFHCMPSDAGPHRSLCVTTGLNDPFKELITSHMAYYANQSLHARGVDSHLLFFVGDTQAHEYDFRYLQMRQDTAITALVSTAISVAMEVFPDPRTIVWTPGNK